VSGLRARGRWLWLAGIAVAALGTVWWLQADSRRARYVTAPVDRGDVVETVSANGTLNPVTLVNVGTQVSGTVVKLLVDFNDRVAQGQVLLELDASTYAAQVRQSEASLRSVTAAAQLARRNANRAEDLFKDGYISSQERDLAQQLAKSSAAQSDLVQAQLDRDRVNLGYTVIRSPVAGTVVSREVDVGQTVAASFQTPTLFKIAQDLSKMQIDSNFAEADIGRIRKGASAHFTVDAFPSREFVGNVHEVRLNPKTVQNVVTYDVVVVVDNSDHNLLPGMTAYVNIVLAELRSVLRVPNAALRFRPLRETGDGGGAAVRPTVGGSDAAAATNESAKSQAQRTLYTLRAGKLTPVRVRLGGADKRFTEVLGGDLHEGDAVAISSTSDGHGPDKAAAPRVRVF
jgi:HlyD family secretion protein